jgi:hypothetical protein
MESPRDGKAREQLESAPQNRGGDSKERRSGRGGLGRCWSVVVARPHSRQHPVRGLGNARSMSARAGWTAKAPPVLLQHPTGRDRAASPLERSQLPRYRARDAAHPRLSSNLKEQSSNLTKITVRERTKINAVLTSIHAQGHNASAVTAAAKALMSRGARPLQAYEQALNTALAGDDNAAREIGRIVAQINASDDRTVAQYDRALSSYIQTGTPAAMAAVAPMIVRDAVALAVRNGEIKQEDVDAGRLDWAAVGMSPESAQAAYTAEPASAPAVPSARSEFAFQPGAQAKQEAPSQPGVIRTASGGVRIAPTGEQARREAGLPIGVTGVKTATGYRPPMTGERLARWHGTPLPQVPQPNEAE